LALLSGHGPELPIVVPFNQRIDKINQPLAVRELWFWSFVSRAGSPGFVFDFLEKISLDEPFFSPRGYL
jgi:hypothetical protein